MKYIITFFLIISSLSTYSQNSKVTAENGMTEAEAARKTKILNDIEELVKRENQLISKLPVISLTSGDCSDINARLTMESLEKVIFAHENSQAKNVCLQIVRKYQELNKDYSTSDNRCSEYDYDLKRAKNDLQSYKDCFAQKSNETNNSSKNVTVKLSDNKTSNSDTKKNNKVISKEEYERNKNNIDNYESRQRLKNLKTQGYTNGQATVMNNYEDQKKTDEKIVNSISKVTESLFKYDEDKYFASQNRKIAKMKARRKLKAERKKEKAKKKEKKSYEKRFEKNMEILDKEVNIELDKIREKRIAKGDILRTERIEKLLKEGQGEIKSYFETGELESVINYNQGEYKLYYISGQLDIVTNFKNGKIDGLKKRYHRNGKLMYAETYKNGLIYGKIKYFDWKGNLKSTKIYKIVNGKSKLVREKIID